MPILFIFFFIITHLQYSWSHIFSGVAVLFVSSIILMAIGKTITDQYNQIRPDYRRDGTRLKLQVGFWFFMTIPSVWIADKFMSWSLHHFK